MDRLKLTNNYEDLPFAMSVFLGGIIVTLVISTYKTPRKSLTYREYGGSMRIELNKRSEP
jgi:hypothetical protein